jgi:hypothetical protein
MTTGDGSVDRVDAFRRPELKKRKGYQAAYIKAATNEK